MVRRPLPAPGVRTVDPILMIDEMGPVDYAPGEAVGAPDHPHRGFETVTCMLAGEFEHRDSAGHAGSLRPGDVQWMTAGRGVVHSEMPSARILREGGRVHGFQIWVNLPARLKMTQPRYQELAASAIPGAETGDGLARVRVIAGEALGVAARIDTHTPIVCQHWTLLPGARVEQALPVDHNGLVYVFAGELQSNGVRIADGQMAVLGAGDAVELAAPAGNAVVTQVLLLGGVPLNEPVVQHGPFVMNTEEEIAAAIRDYQAGSMGVIEPAGAE
jgi:redox-sensitive bicupin YhaK (pirin superfamily)